MIDDPALAGALRDIQSGRLKWVTPPSADISRVLAKRNGSDFADSYWLVEFFGGRHAIIYWGGGCHSCGYGEHGACYEAATVDETLRFADADVAAELRDILYDAERANGPRSDCPDCNPFCGCGWCGECNGSPFPKCPYHD